VALRGGHRQLAAAPDPAAIRPNLLWPDGEGRPPLLDGTVVPESEAAAPAAAPPADPSGPKPEGRPAEEPGRPAPAAPSRGTPETPRPKQAPGLPPPTAEGRPAGASAEADPFLRWLRERLARPAAVNRPEARLHVLPGGTLALVTPAVFRDFDAEGWQRAQKRFQRLRLHRRRPDGTNIWTCRVRGEREEGLLKVMLLPEAEGVLGVPLPPPNRHLELMEEPPAEEPQDPAPEAEG